MNLVDFLLELLQCNAQITCLLITLVSILAQRLRYDLFETRGYVGVDTSYRNGHPRQDGLNDGAAGGATKRLAPRGHLVQHQTKREDVRTRVQRVSAHLLGRHVGRSAAYDSDDRSGVRRIASQIHSRIRDSFGNELCQTKIEHFSLAALRDKNIRRLDVAVD